VFQFQGAVWKLKRKRKVKTVQSEDLDGIHADLTFCVFLLRRGCG